MTKGKESKILLETVYSTTTLQRDLKEAQSKLLMASNSSLLMITNNLQKKMKQT